MDNENIYILLYQSAEWEAKVHAKLNITFHIQSLESLNVCWISLSISTKRTQKSPIERSAKFTFLFFFFFVSEQRQEEEVFFTCLVTITRRERCSECYVQQHTKLSFFSFSSFFSRRKGTQKRNICSLESGEGKTRFHVSHYIRIFIEKVKKSSSFEPEISLLEFFNHKLFSGKWGRSHSPPRIVWSWIIWGRVHKQK